MTTALDLGSLASTAEDFRSALVRLDDAAADAAAAWRQLPEALNSPGVTLGMSRLVAPAHTLSSSLLASADSLHGALASTAETLRWLESQAAAAADDTSWGIRADDTVASCAASITAITGGESGSVALPHPSIARTLRSAPQRSTSVTFGPAAPGLPSALDFLNAARTVGSGIAAGAEAAGSAVASGAGAAAVGVGATIAGLLGVAGLVLSMGGSTDTAAQERSRAARLNAQTHDQTNRIPRAGIDSVRITPYTPCNPEDHGPDCQLRHMRVEKPGDEPFTGAKVKGDETPGEMPGTKSNWTRERSSDDKGWVYKDPNSGVSQRVVRDGSDPRYPNGYVQFTNKNGQVIDLDGRTVPRTSDAAHVVRNPDGSFPIPRGRWK